MRRWLLIAALGSTAACGGAETALQLLRLQVEAASFPSPPAEVRVLSPSALIAVAPVADDGSALVGAPPGRNYQLAVLTEDGELLPVERPEGGALFDVCEPGAPVQIGPVLTACRADQLCGQAVSELIRCQEDRQDACRDLEEQAQRCFEEHSERCMDLDTEVLECERRRTDCEALRIASQDCWSNERCDPPGGPLDTCRSRCAPIEELAMSACQRDVDACAPEDQAAQAPGLPRAFGCD